MKFIDEVEITVRAGDGGNGCVSFRREKFVPRGGPDGGDGGKGGSIYLVGDRHKESLIDFAYKRIYKAGRGMHGKGNNQTGKDGKDIFIPVPLGTDVYNNEREVLLGEILKDGQRLLVARGGRGGRGNARFKSPVHQTPEEYEEGEPGEVKKIYLELRLLAD
ncbi:MAG: GTPase ObgE, partial [candidate division WOR-3 bacterium]